MTDSASNASLQWETSKLSNLKTEPLTDEREVNIKSNKIGSGSESLRNRKIKPKTPKKRRRYRSLFLGFGFIPNRDEEFERAQCVVCGRVLGNDALKPSGLRRHMEKVHKDLVGKPIEYFRSLLRHIDPTDSIHNLIFPSDEIHEDGASRAGDVSRPKDIANSIDTLVKDSDWGSKPKTLSSHRKKRRYHSSFLKYGFISRRDHGEELEKPQCLVCGRILANAALKPSSLERHIQTLHKELVDKPVRYFEDLRNNVNLEELDYRRPQRIITLVRPNEGTLIASYIVALRLAKAGKPFVTAEELILPCMKDVCAEMFDEAAVAKINSISVSKETVTRRVKELADDIEDQLWKELKVTNFYSLYIDESTDVTNKAFLLVYIRYEYSCNVKEELLCSVDVPYKTSVIQGAVFEALNSYMISHELSWTNCVGVCTDGAATLTGSASDLVIKIKEISPLCRITHCLIRRELLVNSKRSSELSKVLSEAIKIVNYVKVNAQDTRLLLLLSDNMQPMDEQYLQNTESRWLSKGKVLLRVLELRNELALYLMEKKAEWAQLFQEPGWLVKLAYLADIFTLLNEINSSVQGKLSSVFHMYDKIYALKIKLRVWEGRVVRFNFDMFPTCANIIDEGIQDFFVHELASAVVGHLRSLQGQLDTFFPDHSDPRTGSEWIRNPFASVNISRTCLSAPQEDKLIELSSDKGLEAVFESDIGLTEFWIKIHNEYPELSDYALKFLMLFSNTYMCEVGFIAFSSLMTTNRNRLNFQSPLRVALSKIHPRIQKLASGKQAQKSH